MMINWPIGQFEERVMRASSNTVKSNYSIYIGSPFCEKKIKLIAQSQRHLFRQSVATT